MNDILQDLNDQWDQGFHDPLWGRSINEITKLRAELATKNARIAELERQLGAAKANSWLDGVNNMAKEANAIIKRKDDELSTIRAEIEALRKRVAELQAAGVNLIGRAEQAEKRVEESSKNWSPTHQEGWEAHATGWPLYEGHTKQYQEGWIARELYVRSFDRPTSAQGSPR